MNNTGVAIIYYYDIEDDMVLVQECRDFYGHIKSLKVFGDYCNINTFIALFGNEEGERLWNCYVLDANRNIYNLFFQYLNNEQLFVLIANIMRNRDLEMTKI